MSVTTIPADRPAIDPYPLSPYVAWAGNRNRNTILKVFADLFPKTGDVLELASGSGMHINYFAPHFPNLRFQPSDYNPDVFETIKAKRAEAGNSNVADPIAIDLTKAESWPDPKDRRYDAIFVINLFQVAPVAIIDGIAQVAASCRNKLPPCMPFRRTHWVRCTRPSFDTTTASASIALSTDTLLSLPQILYGKSLSWTVIIICRKSSE